METSDPFAGLAPPKVAPGGPEPSSGSASSSADPFSGLAPPKSLAEDVATSRVEKGPVYLDLPPDSGTISSAKPADPNERRYLWEHGVKSQSDWDALAPEMKMRLASNISSERRRTGGLGPIPTETLEERRTAGVPKAPVAMEALATAGDIMDAPIRALGATVRLGMGRPDEAKRIITRPRESMFPNIHKASPVAGMVADVLPTFGLGMLKFPGKAAQALEQAGGAVSEAERANILKNFPKNRPLPERAAVAQRFAKGEEILVSHPDLGEGRVTGVGPKGQGDWLVDFGDKKKVPVNPRDLRLSGETGGPVGTKAAGNPISAPVVPPVQSEGDRVAGAVLGGLSKQEPKPVKAKPALLKAQRKPMLTEAELEEVRRSRKEFIGSEGQPYRMSVRTPEELAQIETQMRDWRMKHRGPTTTPQVPKDVAPPPSGLPLPQAEGAKAPWAIQAMLIANPKIGRGDVARVVRDTMREMGPLPKDRVIGPRSPEVQRVWDNLILDGKIDEEGNSLVRAEIEWMKKNPPQRGESGAASTAILTRAASGEAGGPISKELAPAVQPAGDVASQGLPEARSLGAAGKIEPFTGEARRLAKPFVGGEEFVKTARELGSFEKAANKVASTAWSGLGKTKTGQAIQRGLKYGFQGDAEAVSAELGGMEEAAKGIRELGALEGGSILKKGQVLGASAEDQSAIYKAAIGDKPLPPHLKAKVEPIFDQTRRAQNLLDELQVMGGTLSEEAVKERQLLGGIQLPRKFRVIMHEQALARRHPGGGLPSQGGMAGVGRKVVSPNRIKANGEWVLLGDSEGAVRETMQETKTFGKELYAHEAEPGQTLVKFPKGMTAERDVLLRAAKEKKIKVVDSGDALTDAERKALDEVEDFPSLAAYALQREGNRAASSLFFRGIAEKFSKPMPENAAIIAGHRAVDDLAKEIPGFDPKRLGPYLQGRVLPEDVYKVVRDRIQTADAWDDYTRGMIAAYKEAKIHAPGGMVRNSAYNVGPAALRAEVSPFTPNGFKVWKDTNADLKRMAATGEYTEDMRRMAKFGVDVNATKADIALADAALFKPFSDINSSEFKKGYDFGANMIGSWYGESLPRSVLSGAAHGSVRGMAEGIPILNVTAGVPAGAIRGAVGGAFNYAMVKTGARDWMQAKYAAIDKHFKLAIFKEHYPKILGEEMAARGGEPLSGDALEAVKDAAAKRTVDEWVIPFSQYNKPHGAVVQTLRGTGKVKGVSGREAAASVIGRAAGNPWASWEAENIRMSVEGAKRNPAREVAVQLFNQGLVAAGAYATIAAGQMTWDQVKKFRERHPGMVPYPTSSGKPEAAALVNAIPDPVAAAAEQDLFMNLAIDAAGSGLVTGVASDIARSVAYANSQRREATTEPRGFMARRDESPLAYAVRTLQTRLASPISPVGSQARSLEQEATDKSKGLTRVPTSPMRRGIEMMTGVKTIPADETSERRRDVQELSARLSKVEENFDGTFIDRNIGRSVDETGAYTDSRARDAALRAASEYDDLLNDMKARLPEGRAAHLRSLVDRFRKKGGKASKYQAGLLKKAALGVGAER